MTIDLFVNATEPSIAPLFDGYDDRVERIALGRQAVFNVGWDGAALDALVEAAVHELRAWGVEVERA